MIGPLRNQKQENVPNFNIVIEKVSNSLWIVSYDNNICYERTTTSVFEVVAFFFES